MKNMKKRSILSLAFVAVALMFGLTAASQAMSSSVQADGRAMAAANELLAAGHIDQAGAIYRQLLDQGVEDATVFYNLGNVAMLQGNPARALTLYEQAAELSPRDSDIRHNLEMAREQAGVASGSDAHGLLASMAQASRSLLTVNELAMLALGAWFLLGFLVLAYRHFQPGERPWVLRMAGTMALVVVVMSGVALVSRMQV